MLISNIVAYLEALYPKHLAYDKDPIGLHLGQTDRLLTKVLVTLDVTVEVVQEAIEKGANLIVAHHPFIYRPLKTIDTSTAKGKIVQLCLKHDIAIYAMHTNYDIADNGMNDVLAKALGLKSCRPLSVTREVGYAKLAVFVPETHAEEVRQVMGDAGVGQLGDYSHCTFSATGTGRFLPLSGSEPFIGEPGQLEAVAEVKIEGIALETDIPAILAKVTAAHPYEEPAYDVFKLQLGSGKTYGLGRVGTAHTVLSARDYIAFAKEALGVSHARYSGCLEQEVGTVAVVGGSGSGFLQDAKKAGADLYITGDMGFHDAHDALEMGLNVLDVGHYAEALMKGHVASLLQERFGAETAIASEKATNPFQFV